MYLYVGQFQLIWAFWQSSETFLERIYITECVIFHMAAGLLVKPALGIVILQQKELS